MSANEGAFGEGVGWLVIGLSLFDRFYGFAQGVIDLRDVVFFVALIALFLFLALRALGARAWRGVV
jgi:gliding motility-associated transport system permease protein